MSIRSRLVLFLLKHRHWFRLRLKRETIDWNTSIPALRQQVEKSGARLGKVPAGLEVTTAAIPGFYAEWLRHAASTHDRVMLYFHGGGYVMGSARSHRGIIAKFVVGSGIDALLFDYRLAPEHPFPAALDDSLTAYRWLLEQGFSPERIVFAGDSAGAGLCLATLLAVRDNGLPLPAAAAVLSPWTDLKCTGNSYTRRDPLAPEGSWAVYSAYYAGNNDPALPLISPLYGDLAGLPPLLIYVGEDESMLDDSVRFAEKAQAAGVDVRLHVGRGMVHCYPALAPLFPEATAALDDICAFLAASIGHPATAATT
jgi:monoterpene epsilon-lactone hydrolase